MGNNLNIFAGEGAGGADGTGLAWFAPTGSTAPTDATTTLDAAFRNAGMITEDGVTAKFNESSKKVKAFGSQQTQRTLVTDSESTFDLAFLEQNQYSLAIFFRKAIGSITPTVGTGAFSLTSGAYVRQLYAAVFDVIDGTNHLRAYCPSCEVTNRNDVKISNGNENTWPVTITAYPNSSGVAVQWFFVMSALG